MKQDRGGDRRAAHDDLNAAPVPRRAWGDRAQRRRLGYRELSDEKRDLIDGKPFSATRGCARSNCSGATRRRQLNAPQRSMVAARIRRAMRGIVPVNLQSVESTAKSQHTQPEIVAVAESFNVSPSSVDSAKRVLAKGVPELADAIYSGMVAVSRAAEIASLFEAEQREHVAEVLSRRERLRVVAKDNAEKAKIASHRYPRRVLKKLNKDYASLPAAEQAEFMTSRGRMSLDHVLARLEDLFDSDLAAVTVKALKHIRSKEYDPQLATIWIAAFNKIHSAAERLRVDEVVG
jgi:hypothetical protein